MQREAEQQKDIISQAAEELKAQKQREIELTRKAAEEVRARPCVCCVRL